MTLWADLPGVARDSLEIRVQGGNLRIEAFAGVPMRDGLRLQHVEVRVPNFARSFTLGPEFDPSEIEADLKDGVLKLLIPRREEARPRRIEVTAGVRRLSPSRSLPSQHTRKASGQLPFPPRTSPGAA